MDISRHNKFLRWKLNAKSRMLESFVRRDPILWRECQQLEQEVGEVSSGRAIESRADDFL